jgi:peptidyl-tRNA hydrolase, PTH1 family
MKIVVGLGNPGAKYQFSRHNVGFLVLDLLADSYGFNFSRSSSFEADISKGELFSEKCLFVKPSTFMNLSGRSVAKIARYYGVSCTEILVIHDDLDLTEFEVRYKELGGHGGHNGVRSLIECLGANQFSRIKIGIGRPDPENSLDISDWVLKSFPKNKLDNFHEEVIIQVEKYLQKFLN